jgi:1-acyl-sn-glycerol-3-phosphate acyltransferase
MKYILSLLSWTLGSLTLLFCFPILLVTVYTLDQRRMTPICRFMVRTVVRGFLVRVRCEGLRDVDLSRNYVFMANHASFFDQFILSAYLPGITRGIEAAEHFSWPLWGRFIRKAGLLPIDRSDPRASMRTMKKAAENIRQGISMLVLPEGTRSRDGRMLPFKKLPFKLAKMAKCGIVPIGISGTFDIKPKTRWLIKPGSAIIRYGEPISAEEVAGADLVTLMGKTRERIVGLLEREERERCATSG